MRARLRPLTVAVVAGGRGLCLTLALAVLTSCTWRGGRTSSPVSESAITMRFPRDAARFELQPLTDSTVSFIPAEASWVRSGIEGIAVDPARGDALVARLRVFDVTGGTATAMVTGQTTRVASGHVLLLVQPRVPWWKQRLFWLGALGGAGLVTGVVTLL